MICIWSSWCHCHPVISCASKIQNGLPFWCWLTQVVLEKRSLNGCNSSIILLSLIFVEADPMWNFPSSLFANIVQYYLPLHLITRPAFAEWMELVSRVADRPVPEVCLHAVHYVMNWNVVVVHYGVTQKTWTLVGVSQRRCHLISVSPNADRFSKLCHGKTRWWISNRVVIKDPTTPEMSQHYFVKCLAPFWLTVPMARIFFMCHHVVSWTSIMGW